MFSRFRRRREQPKPPVPPPFVKEFLFARKTLLFLDREWVEADCLAGVRTALFISGGNLNGRVIRYVWSDPVLESGGPAMDDDTIMLTITAESPRA